jgi:hypothetical protein
VIAEVESLGDVNPEVQRRLLAELRNCDPALWPLVAQQVRAALAYQRQQAAKAAANLAAATPGANLPPGAAPAANGHAPAAVAQDPAAKPIAAQGPPPQQQLAPGAPSPTSPAASAPGGAVAASPASPTAPTRAEPPPNKSSPNENASHPVQRVSYERPADGSDWNAHLAAAIEGLESQTREPAHDADSIARHAYLRMLYLAAGRRDDALRPIAGITAAQQDYWSKQLYALSAYLDSERIADPSRRAADAVAHLSQAAAKLGELGPLVVKNLTFCTEVNSYGVFKRFEHDEFKPGQQALLYAEVENFRSDETADGFHTALQSSYQILDSQGRRVAQDDFPLTEERCQNRRRDYFIRYFLSLPPQIYEGRYTLELTIEDTLGRKIGQSTIEFTVKGSKRSG